MSDQQPSNTGPAGDALERALLRSPAAAGDDPRLARLLGLLDAGLPQPTAADRGRLVGSTLSRIDAHRPSLTTADADALDDLLADPARVRPSDPRARRAAALLSLLDAPAPAGASPAADRDRLIDATMARVEQRELPGRERFRLRPADPAALRPARPGLRLSDLGAIAAVILVGVGVLMPVFSGLRHNQRVAATEQNLQAASLGLNLFANDHDDRLPSRHAVRLPEPAGPSPDARPGPLRFADRALLSDRKPWWAVGDPRASHSANLYTLVRLGYVGLDDLASPGNPGALTAADLRGADPADLFDWRSPDQVSYSYRLFGDAFPPRLSDPGLARSAEAALLTDRSPVIPRARLGLPVRAWMNSANLDHRAQGVLFADGSVRVLDSPVLPSGDSLWLPRTLESQPNPELRGYEIPTSPADNFVGP